MSYTFTQEHAAATTAAAAQKNAKMSRSQPNDSETRKTFCVNGADREKKTKDKKKSIPTEIQYVRIDKT